VSEESRSFGFGRNNRDKDKDKAGFKKRRPKRRTAFRKKRPPASLQFDYKDISSLFSFISEEGKINAARVSGLRGSQQRQLTTAIKRARHIGFLSPVRREFIH